VPPTISIAAPVLPRAEFTVVPAELADPGILDRIPHRTRLRWFGSFWLRAEDVAPQVQRTGDDNEYVLPVIGETRTRIRVAFEDDDARMAMWIARDDTWSIAALPIELSDAAGIARRDAGVFVVRGAPLTLGEKTGERRAVQVRDELLELRGYVPDAVIAHVWITGAGDQPITFETTRSHHWLPDADLHTRVKLLLGTKLRIAPDGKSLVIATITSPDVTAVIANNLGEYRQIEIVRPYARVLGFVSASEVTYTADELSTHGTGTGHGFGMSHADRINVPAGTCLFDRVDGEVIGVQSKPSTRLGRRGRDADKWSQIHIGTSWTTASVFIRDQSDDPQQPRWESCIQTSHR